MSNNTNNELTAQVTEIVGENPNILIPALTYVQMLARDKVNMNILMHLANELTGEQMASLNALAI